MVAKAVAVLLLVCCLVLVSEAYFNQQCPYGQTVVGFCGQPWWHCPIGSCVSVTPWFGYCCKKFFDGHGYY